MREHGDFLQVQHFFVNGVDQTLTSEKGAGKACAHAQWGGGTATSVGPSPSKLDPATTPTGGQSRFTPVTCLTAQKG